MAIILNCVLSNGFEMRLVATLGEETYDFLRDELRRIL